MGYFHKVHKQTDTRFWINNPTHEEVQWALDNDTFNCTTNPAFCSRIMKTHELAHLEGIVDSLIDEWAASGEEHFDYDKMALEVYRRTTLELMDLFRPLYESSKGEKGYVTLQDDPRFDEDIKHTVDNILYNKTLAPNYMAKIPVINGGIEAIEACIEHNIPVCITEVFAVSQALVIAERVEAAIKKFGNRPPIYITHISGIFDDCIARTAAREGIEVSKEALKQGGIIVARKQFKALEDHGFNMTMLGGGARGLHHFTGIVGGPHVTINWSTAEELIKGDFDVIEEIRKESEQAIIDELYEKFEIFRQAYDEDGLTADEFALYPPVQLFRNAFLEGWYLLLALVARRRNARAI